MLAHRRWTDPEPGQCVVVVTETDDWSPMRTTAQAPTIRVLIYAAPSPGQDDAEAIALAAGDRVRAVLHRPQGGAPTWAGIRVLNCMHVGSSLGEPEGRPDWRLRSLTFEVQTG